MNIPNPIRFVLLVASLCAGLFAVGCATANLNQAALNTGAEGITGDILSAAPSDLPAVIAVAKVLPSIFGTNSSLTSTSLGQLVASVAKTNNMSSAGTDKFLGWLDGALRNANAFQGGVAGGPETMQAAVANQVLGVVADGMNHEVTLYEAAHGLPATQ